MAGGKRSPRSEGRAPPRACRREVLHERVSAADVQRHPVVLEQRQQHVDEAPCGAALARGPNGVVSDDDEPLDGADVEDVA